VVELVFELSDLSAQTVVFVGELRIRFTTRCHRKAAAFEKRFGPLSSIADEWWNAPALKNRFTDE
jgi:hypothetical protein